MIEGRLKETTMSNDESRASDQQQNLPAPAQDASLAKQDQDKPAIPMLDDSTPEDEVRASLPTADMFKIILAAN